MNSFPLVQFRNRQIWRIIPSRYPPVNLFEEVAPAEHWDLLNTFEGRTNQRLLELAFSRGLIRPEDRLESCSSHYITAPLAHPNPEGSTFSNGTYGVLYAGLDFETALAEVRSRREAFLGYTAERPQKTDVRAVVIELNGDLHDLRPFFAESTPSLKQTQDIGYQLREAGSYGVLFPSTQTIGGECVGIFRPPVLSNCRQERHLSLVWDGTKISSVHEYSTSAKRRTTISAS